MMLLSLRMTFILRQASMRRRPTTLSLFPLLFIIILLVFDFTFGYFFSSLPTRITKRVRVIDRTRTRIDFTTLRNDIFYQSIPTSCNSQQQQILPSRTTALLFCLSVMDQKPIQQTRQHNYHHDKFNFLLQPFRQSKLMMGTHEEQQDQKFKVSTIVMTNMTPTTNNKVSKNATTAKSTRRIRIDSDFLSKFDTMKFYQNHYKMIHSIFLHLQMTSNAEREYWLERHLHRRPQYRSHIVGDRNCSTGGDCRTVFFNDLIQLIMQRSSQIGIHPGKLAESILRYMLMQNENDERTNHVGIKPNQLTLNLVLAAYTCTDRQKTVKGSNLDTALDLDGDNNDYIASSFMEGRKSIGYTKKYNDQIQNINVAYNLLIEWDTILYPSNRTYHSSDRVSYHTIMTAYAKLGLCDKVENLLNELLSKASHTTTLSESDTYQPNIRTYNCVLNSYAASGQYEKASNLFKEMILSSSTNNDKSNRIVPLRPTIHTFNSVLYTFAKSDQPLRAYEFFQEWLQVSNPKQKNKPKEPPKSKLGSGMKKKTSRYSLQTLLSNTTGYVVPARPNTYSYNIVLHALTRAIQQENQQMKDRQQQQQFQRGYKYNNRNSVVQLQGKSQMEPIQETETSLRKKDRTDDTSFHTTNDNNEKFVGKDDFKDSIIIKLRTIFEAAPSLDAISYSTLISAYCETAVNMNSSKSKQEILESIRTVAYRALDDLRLQPIDTSTFLSNVLYSLSLVEDMQAAILADELVVSTVQKYDVTPNLKLYNSLIYCWGKSTKPSSPSFLKTRSSQERTPRSDICSQRVLDIINELEMHPLLQPDTITYTNALDALKVSSAISSNKGNYTIKSIEAAEAILTKMEQSEKAKPNVITYTALIQNYGRSRIPNKAMKAFHVLRRMNDRNVQPNIITYNSVLNACEHTDPSIPSLAEETLRIACLVFDEIRASSRTSLVANHITYGAFIGTLSNLMPSVLVDQRQHIISLLFRKCCQDGQVSTLVLKKIRDAVMDQEQYQELLLGYPDNQLPTNWTRNVYERKKSNPSQQQNLQ